MKIHVIASGSTGNCYAVESNGDWLLIECGISVTKIKNWFYLNTATILPRVAGCLISHEHGDHAKAVHEVALLGVPCFASEGTTKAVAGRCYVSPERVTFQAGGWGIMPFAVEHDAAEPFGFLVHAPDGDMLCYITDSHYVKYRMPAGITHMMLECNYSDEIIDENLGAGNIDQSYANRARTNHMSLERAGTLLESMPLDDIREIVLIHLSSANADAKRFRAAIEKRTGCAVRIA